MSYIKNYYFDKINEEDSTDDYDYQYQQYLDSQKLRTKSGYLMRNIKKQYHDKVTESTSKIEDKVSYQQYLQSKQKIETAYKFALSNQAAFDRSIVSNRSMLTVARTIIKAMNQGYSQSEIWSECELLDLEALITRYRDSKNRNA